MVLKNHPVAVSKYPGKRFTGQAYIQVCLSLHNCWECSGLHLVLILQTAVALEGVPGTVYGHVTSLRSNEDLQFLTVRHQHNL